MDSDNQKVYCETSTLWILLLLVVFNVLRFVMKFPLRDCANVPSLPLLDLQSLGFCQKRLHASHPSSWILIKLKTCITSHSQDLLTLFLILVRPPPNPYKSNVDYYRGHTKSIYEREPIFKDFARNIPLSQQNLLDSSNLTSLKNNFQRLVASRAGGQKPDPLRPLAVRCFPWQLFLFWHISCIGIFLDLSDQTNDKSSNCPQIQTRNQRSASEALAEKHQRSRSSTPVVLPHIYVYHRYKHEQNWITHN